MSHSVFRLILHACLKWASKVKKRYSDLKLHQKYHFIFFKIHMTKKSHISAVSNSPPFSSVSTNILPSTTSCLSAPFPIRPIVAHPSQPPTGPLSLLPPFYMPGLPGLYSHQGMQMYSKILYV